MCAVNGCRNVSRSPPPSDPVPEIVKVPEVKDAGTFGYVERAIPTPDFNSYMQS